MPGRRCAGRWGRCVGRRRGPPPVKNSLFLEYLIAQIYRRLCRCINFTPSLPVRLRGRCRWIHPEVSVLREIVDNRQFFGGGQGIVYRVELL